MVLMLLGPRVLGVTCLSCLLLVLAACGGPGGVSNSAQPGQLSVVTAFYPLQFVVERVAGQHAAVSNLTHPGAEPHDVELTPRQVASITDANAVIYLRGFQPAVDQAGAQSGNSHVLDVTSVVPLQTQSQEQAHEHANGTAETGEHDEADPGHDHGDTGHDHDHGELDPHVWLNPLNMVTITEAVVAQLSEIDPDHAAVFRTNARALVAELDRLNAAYVSGLTTCERREFITNHAAFGYLAEEYDLVQIAVSGLSSDAEPSPARIARVHQEAKTHGITTIFYETLVSPAVAESIAGDLGLQTAVLDPIESITADSPGDNYIAVMRSNLTALEKANECQ